MTKSVLLFLACILCTYCLAQDHTSEASVQVMAPPIKDMNLLSTWSAGNTPFNDIWGYLDSQGKEYAIMGSRSHYYFVDISNPTNPQMVDGFAGGNTTIWRDMKTYGQWAYGVCDSCNEGLSIFRLGDSPASNGVEFLRQDKSYFTAAHNIFVDEPNGRLYIIGSNTQAGGVIILDIKTNPEFPILLSATNLLGGYMHDLYVRNNIGYANSANNGLYVYDFSNPTNIQTLGSMTSYPQQGYNHASWLNPAGDVLIMADETSNTSVKAVDVSDLSDIEVTSLFRSELLAPTATGSIAHNPFVRDNYAIISYYHDGVQIFDISDPANVVQTAWYDTFLNNTNYNGSPGCWGVYPYLPSGNIIASDGAGGLFVLEPTEIEFDPMPVVTMPFAFYDELPACIAEGTPVQLSITTDAHTIQWYKDGAEIGFVSSVTVTSEGTYTAKVFKGPHSLTLEPIIISYGIPPNVALNVPSEISICEDDEAEISVAEGADSYEWFLDGNAFESATNRITTNQAGSYTVVVTGDGCTATSEGVQLEVDSYPETGLNFVGVKTLCGEESILLESLSEADSYQWYYDDSPIEDATSVALNATQAGIYYVELSNGNCVLNSLASEIIYNDIPNADLNATGEMIVCEGQPFVLEAQTDADNYDWFQDGTLVQSGTGNEFAVSSSGIYELTVTSANCQSTSEAVSFVFEAQPISSISSNSAASICEGEVNTLVSNNTAVNYQWFVNGQPIPNANQSTYNASAEGEYTLMLSNDNCSSISDPFLVELTSAPEVSLLVPMEIIICEGETTSLSMSEGAAFYNWTLNGSGFEVDERSVTVTEGGTFTGTAANGNCDAEPFEVTVTVQNFPNVEIFNAGPSNILCPGEEINLVTNTDAADYIWLRDGEVVVTNNSNLYTTEPGTYTLQNTNNQCINTSEPIIITAGEVPIANLSTPPNEVRCEGESYTFTVEAGYENYQWSLDGTPINEVSNNLTINTSGNYAVVVTSADGCSTTSQTSTIAFNALPNAQLDAASNQRICAGEQVNLIAPTDADIYTWTLNGNEIASTKSINAEASGTYQLQVQTNGCSSTSQEINITVEDTPVINFDFETIINLCAGESYNTMLDLSFDSYRWYQDGDLFSTNMNVELDEKGVYYLEASSNTCVGTSMNIEVTVQPLPDVSLNQIGDIDICDGETSTLTIAAQADSYTWYQNGDLLSETTNELTISETGDYYAEVVLNGCTVISSTVNLSVNITPLSEIDGLAERELCNGSSEELLCTIIADDYTWFLDDVQISQSINPVLSVSEPGVYTVMTSLGDCTTLSDAVVLTQTNLPNIDNLYDDITRCPAEEINVAAPAGFDQYAWIKDGQLLTVTENELTITEAGIYQLEIQQGTCSTVSNTFVVSYINGPSFEDFPTEIAVCAGEIANIIAPPNMDSYLWIKDGNVVPSTGDMFMTTEVGMYQVEVRVNGCVTLSPVVTITQNVSPTASISFPAEMIVCEGDSLTLFANVSEDVESISWFMDGVFVVADTTSLTVFESGTYTIEATNGTCTTLSEVVNPIIYELPIVTTATTEENICPGEMATLNFGFSGNGNYAFILYLDGTSVPFSSISPLLVGEPGIYTLEVIDFDSGCSSSSDAVVVNVFEVTTPIIDANENILTSSAASSYQWYIDGALIGDATGITYEATESGAYQVETTDMNGCISISEESVVIISAVQSIPSLAAFALYPNPVAELLSISLQTDAKLDLQMNIYNQLGQSLWSQQFSQQGAQTLEVPVEIFSAGVYMLTIRDKKGGLQTIRFVKN